MTQQQQIQLLNDIMPQIVESRDPEATMLKCASKNNLTPAQLEKLGHVFNSMKTLVGLEKQANRGDSFSIVNVPAMVTKYASYDAKRVLTNQAKDVHKKVNKLTKDASTQDIDGWGACLNGYWEKSASASSPNEWMFKSQPTVPVVADWINEQVEKETKGGVDWQDEDEASWKEVGLPEATPGADMFKLASRKVDKYNVALEKIARAKEIWQQTFYEAQDHLFEKCAAIRTAIVHDREAWNKLVMDARDILGLEKSATAFARLEKHFEETRLHGFEKAANINRGFTRRLAYDSTGLVPVVEEIAGLDSIIKRAAALLEPTEQEKQASQKKKQEASLNLPAALVSSPDELLASVTALQPDPKKKQKDFDVQNAANRRQVALQHLMLNDDIISTADPALVQDLQSTIADLSPTVASDPIRLAPVLKEALQYDSLPIQQIKDLLSVEEAAQKVQKLKHENETNLYS